MELQKLNVKFFVEKPDSIPLTDFIDVFHNWIQATDGVYHDVALRLVRALAGHKDDISRLHRVRIDGRLVERRRIEILEHVTSSLVTAA